MTGFSQIDGVRIAAAEIERGQLHLRRVGATGNEGMVLWVGRTEGCIFQVTQAVVPQQRGIQTQDGVCVVVEGSELHRLNVELYRAGLVLFAQVHSHPGRAYHSPTDDAYAVATVVGSLSLVVPDFARRPFSLAETATYRLDATGQWRGLSPGETQQLIMITD